MVAAGAAGVEAAGVVAVAAAGAAGVAVLGAVTAAGAIAVGAFFSRATKPRYRPKLRMKRMTVRVVVILERTLADSPPKTDSAAPPPRAEPMPALAEGRCIRMIRTTSRQTRKRTTTEAYRRKSFIPLSKGSENDKTTPKSAPDIGPLADPVGQPVSRGGWDGSRSDDLVAFPDFLPKSTPPGVVQFP